MLTKIETDCNEVEQRYYSMKEAAAYAGVAINTLRRWVYVDGLPAVRRGRVVRIRKDELERWLAPNIRPAKEVA